VGMGVTRPPTEWVFEPCPGSTTQIDGSSGLFANYNVADKQRRHGVTSQIPTPFNRRRQ
jgi:hypothetical protein